MIACTLWCLSAAAEPSLGGTWQALQPPSTPLPDLTDASFSTSDSGFVCGSRSSRGVLFHTLDGGSSWSAITLPGSPAPLNDLDLSTSSPFGVVAGDSGYVAVTSDGGRNWTDRSIGWTTWPSGGHVEAVTFTDSLHGWAVGRALSGSGPRFAATTDGGRSWAPVAQSATPANNLYDVGFITSTRALAIGTGRPPRLSRSTDAGATWTRFDTLSIGALEDGSSKSMYVLSSINGGATVFAAGGKPFPRRYAELRLSTDGGATWMPTAMSQNPVRYPDPIGGLHAESRNVLLAATQGGQIELSRDGGSTWMGDTVPGSVGSADLHRFSLAPDNTIYVVGDGGRILRSRLVPRARLHLEAEDTIDICPGSRRTTSLALADDGTANLRVADIAPVTSAPSSDVAVSVTSAPTLVDAGDQVHVDVDVEAAPGARPGLRRDTLLVRSNDGNAPTTEAVPMLLRVSSCSLSVNKTADAGSALVNVGTSVSFDSLFVNNSDCDIAVDSVTMRFGTHFSVITYDTDVPIGEYMGAILIQFIPKTTCDLTDYIRVYYNGGSFIQTQITGRGIAPVFETNPPDTLDFGNVPVNTPTARDLAMRDPGPCSAQTTLTGFTIRGAAASLFSTTFTASVSSPVRIDPDDSVVAPVSVTVTAIGRVTAYVVIDHNAPNGSHDTVWLVANGVRADVQMANTIIDFGTRGVGGVYDSTLTGFIDNDGGVDLTVTGVRKLGVDTAYFSYVGPSPPFTIAAGEKQTITVRFLPDVARTYTARLAFDASFSDGTSRVPTVALSGTAQWAIIDAGKPDMLFLSVPVNTCLKVTRYLHNVGRVPLHIDTIAVEPDPGFPGDEGFFSVVAPIVPPETVIPPDDSLKVVVQYCPTRAGFNQAQLHIVSNTQRGVDTVLLKGTGQAASFSEVTQVLFDSTRVGLTDDTVITRFIYNDQPGPLVIDSVRVTGGPDVLPFDVATPVDGTTVASGDSLSITLRFAPRRRNRNQGFLWIYTPVGSHQIALEGWGIYPFLRIEPDDPSNLRVRLGMTRRLRINITNDGDDTSHVSSATIAGDASFSNPNVGAFPVTLGVGESIPIEVDFTPDRLCEHAAQITLHGEGIQGIYAPADTVVHFAAFGVVPMLGSRRPEVNFGVRPLGSINDTVTTDFLGNMDFTGTIDSCLDATEIDRMELTGADASSFSVSVPQNLDSLIALPANTFQDLAITFNPQRLGLHEADLVVHFDGSPDSTYVVHLLGTASNLPVRYGPEPDMVELDFGRVRIGTSRDSLFTARNVSEETLRFDEIRSSLPAELQIVSPLPSQLPIDVPSGDSVTIRVRFAPTTPQGVRSAYVVFRSGGVADSSFALLGTAVDERMRAEPDTVDFRRRTVGSINDTAVSLINEPTPEAPLAAFIDTVAIDQAVIVSGGAQFQVISAPPLVPGPGRDSILIRFTPSGPSGPVQGLLRIYHSGRTDSLDVVLNGYVVGEELTLAADLGADQTSRPGATVVIPISLDGDLAGYNVDTIDVRLRFRRTMLRPTAVGADQPGATATLLTPTSPNAPDGEQIVRIASNAPLTSGAMASVAFDVLVGDALATEVVLDSIGSPGPVALAVRADSVTVTIDDFCDAAQRLVRFGSTQAIKAVPNPAHDRMGIAWTVPALEPTRVAIYDADGREVLVLMDRTALPGTYTADVDLSQLPAGAYYCVLRAGRFIETTTIQVTQ